MTPPADSGVVPMTQPWSLCAHCDRPLSSVTIAHGWVSVRVTHHVVARVHTVCKESFERRTFEEQKARAIRQ